MIHIRDDNASYSDLDTSKIKDWRSIITLIVFVVTNLVVLFPFHVPLYAPRILWDALLNTLVALRIIPPSKATAYSKRRGPGPFVRFGFPLNFVTAPLIADLFLLAILAIGRTEVHDGTIGAENISPLDIMLFFLSLAYIAISIDASGLIRYLAFRVLKWGGDVGHRLFFYLYAFFLALTSFIGNDPVILSGTAFLAYMTRVSSNIVHPRAWIYSQFAVANIGSAILVSSNPTNLVIAGAFRIQFIKYTANIIVPVVVTGIVLFPFLLYIVFAEESLIPLHIEMHELPEEARGRAPRNPNIPTAAKNKRDEQGNDLSDDEAGKMLPLEEIMNPYLDKAGAAFGGIIMATALITLLAVNASSAKTGQVHVFWVTVPAAFLVLCFDLAWGWMHRHETRRIAREGRLDEHVMRVEDDTGEISPQLEVAEAISTSRSLQGQLQSRGSGAETDKSNADLEMQQLEPKDNSHSPAALTGQTLREEKDPELMGTRTEKPNETLSEKRTLVGLIEDRYRWAQETFPTTTTVLAHLPFPLVPFAFCMFILVQGLVTKGWVPVFAYGWDHWVNKTGTVGAVGGMGFLAVILCNFAGTNIGTSILLSRVIQEWQRIHDHNGLPITDRTFWATVYSLALGVNYGAFSIAFSASLAGLLWRDILARKHIRIHSLDFARVNLPIIAIAMTVGCSVLIGEVYLIRDHTPYNHLEQ